MTQKEFDEKFPLIFEWIQNKLAEHAANARPIVSMGFNRLPHYFRPEILSAAKVIYVAKAPTPPLSTIGLSQFSDFENMSPDGITYMDTFFLRNEMRRDEALHFHELVHVIQWQLLGPKSFMAAYADGLERIGYRASPLETMAYTLDSVFRNSQTTFDVATIVQEQLHALYS